MGLGAGRTAIPRIYALADREALGETPLPDAVRRMVDGGVRWIQVRAKHAPDDVLANDLESCCRLLEGSDAKLWINDRADLARLLPVAGVHLGQDDLPPGAARAVVGADRWIGRSTHTPRQAREAEADPAVDVVAIGPIHATTGKSNPEPVVGLGGLRESRRATSKPLVAIGGIGRENLAEVLAAGADAVAVLGAVCRGDVEANCRRLVAEAGCAA